MGAVVKPILFTFARTIYTTPTPTLSAGITYTEISAGLSMSPLHLLDSNSVLINCREHVHRNHLRAVQCERCGGCWGDNGQLKRHRRKPNSCPLVPSDELPNISSEDESLFAALKKSSKETKNYVELCRVLFPDREFVPLPSTYINQPKTYVVYYKIQTVANHYAPETRIPTEVKNDHPILAEETSTAQPPPPVEQPAHIPPAASIQPSAPTQPPALTQQLAFIQPPGFIQPFGLILPLAFAQPPAPIQPLASTQPPPPTQLFAPTQPLDTGSNMVELAQMLAASRQENATLRAAMREVITILSAAMGAQGHVSLPVSLSPPRVHQAPENSQPPPPTAAPLPDQGCEPASQTEPDSTEFDLASSVDIVGGSIDDTLWFQDTTNGLYNDSQEEQDGMR